MRAVERIAVGESRVAQVAVRAGAGEIGAALTAVAHRVAAPADVRPQVAARAVDSQCVEGERVARLHVPEEDAVSAGVDVGHGLVALALLVGRAALGEGLGLEPAAPTVRTGDEGERAALARDRVERQPEGHHRPAAHAQGSIVAQWGYHEKGYRNFYLLLDDIAQYNKSVCNGFRWAAESLDGLNIVGFDSFQNNDPSVQAQIDRMRSISEPIDAIVLCSFVPGGASVIKQIRDNGIDTPILTDGAMDGNFWIDAVPNIDEVYVTAFGSVYGDDPDPKVEAFMDRFEEHYGERPATGYALPGYALIEMWALAVENAGTVETEPVVEALENLRDIETVAGPRSYSKDLHIQNKVRYLMIGWHNGEHKIEGYWTTGPIPVEVLLAN